MEPKKPHQAKPQEQKAPQGVPQNGTQEFTKEMEHLKQEADRLKDIAGRAQADLQNAKDRMRREAEDMRRFAVEAVLMKLLPTVANFQRAFTHLPADLKDHEWVKGVSALEQDFLKVLKDLGLQSMESLGKTADPAFHEVLQTGDGEPGKIIEVFEEGYLLHGKVLRPAKVRVGAAK